MKNRKLLFLGDLPPKYLTGTSNSSYLILESIKDECQITVVEEDDSFNYSNFKYYLKIFNVINKCIKLFSISVYSRFDIFYLVFSASTFGSIKTLFYLISVKIVSPKTKIFIHIHRGDFFNMFFIKTSNRIIWNIILKLSNTVILLSKTQLEEFSKKFPKTKFVVLENSLILEPKSFKFEYREKYTSNFIFISNYFKEKGILDLLEVFNELVDEGYNVELDSYGSYSSDFLKNQILNLGSKSIRIHDAITNENKYKVIRNSIGLILPSWNEGQPLVLLEAMANGTPVIATKVGLIPEMLGYDYPYLVSPKDKKELKEVIISFISDKNKQLIAENLFVRYKQFYSQALHREKVQGIFKLKRIGKGYI
ncbi:glycosyltransferase family 4 protein [Lunatimonas salinarum]|uniref:glycosyltransferase family 4 protein n=1 Tax=Lunatimonas salinarum TaxID=1774590 RepID=UPI001ADEF2A3|nr:glycosyltransferase family 4 protein [Lunatimonas salinarum]